MKKIVIVSLLALAFLIVTSTVAYLLRFTEFNATVLLIAGAVVLVVSAFVAFTVKENIVGNGLCYIVNAIALGCCIRAWYLFRGFDNPLWVMYLVSLASVVELWLFYLLAKIPLFNRHGRLYFWLYLLVSLVAYILVVIFTKTTFVSTFGYYMIVEAAFIFAFCSDDEGFSDLFRSMTIASFSVLIVAVIVAFMMITEGDGFDLDFGGEFVDIGGGKEKKKKTPLK